MINKLNTSESNTLLMPANPNKQLSSNFHASPSQLNLEFLEDLLRYDDASYPWNPADEESESYFVELEQQCLIQDVLDEELTARSQTFYNQLDTLWSNHRQLDNSTIIQTTVTTLKENLQTSFGSSIPSHWLNLIVRKAAEVFNHKQSISEQLIDCAQSVLPTWGIEDLLVLARPYAYAMRSGETQNLESVLNNVDDREWTALSEIEQAKATVAIAYYTLNLLNSSQKEA